MPILSFGILRLAMHFPLLLVIPGLLRFLPVSTASPVTPTVIQSVTDTCKDPSTTGMTSLCWATLKMNDFFKDWTNTTTMPNAPMIGTLVCRPNEAWASCFVRFAYGQQRAPGPPMDCVTFTSKTCQPPSAMMVKPSSPQYWYGAYAIYGTFSIILLLPYEHLKVLIIILKYNSCLHLHYYFILCLTPIYRPKRRPPISVSISQPWSWRRCQRGPS